MKDRYKRSSLNHSNVLLSQFSQKDQRNKRQSLYDCQKETEFQNTEISKQENNDQLNIFGIKQSPSIKLLNQKILQGTPKFSKLSLMEQIQDKNIQDQEKKYFKSSQHKQKNNDIVISERVDTQEAMIQQDSGSLYLKDSIYGSSIDNYTPLQYGLPKKKSSFSPQHSFFVMKKITLIKQKLWYFFKNFTSSGRSFYLSNLIRQVIEDKSDVIQLDRDVSYYKKLAHCLTKRLIRIDFQIQKCIGLFVPHSQISFIVLLLICTINILFFITFSIVIIFQGQPSNEYLLYKVMSILWVLEILFHFNTKIYYKSILVSDRSQIIKAYIKKRIFYDLIPILFLLVLPKNLYQRKFLQVLTFIKLKNVLTDVEMLQKHLCMTLVNLIIKIFIIGHVISCIWYLIGQIELNILGYEKTWYDEGLADIEQTWYVLYLQSLFWSLTLMTTGSNVASTLPQMVFTTFIMIFTTILFGYLMNVTGIIICQLDKKSESKRLDLNIINDYMRSYKISKDLQLRVNNDIENYYKSNMDEKAQEKQQVIQKISPTLQNLLKLEYCSQILDKVKIIRSRFSKEVIIDLSNELEEEYYLPNQTIFTQDQKDNLSLMIIAKGSVEISQSFIQDNHKHKSLYTLKRGQILGEYNFFSGQCHEQNAKSCEFTKIVKINRDKFIQIVQKRERENQIFCQIRDQIMNYGRYDVIYKSCKFCQNPSHLESDCHLIHIQRDYLYQKTKFNERVTQHREKFQRKKENQLKTLSNIVKLKKDIQNFQKISLPQITIEQLLINYDQQINSNSSISYLEDKSDEEDSSDENYLSSNKSNSNHSSPQKSVEKQVLSKITKNIDENHVPKQHVLNKFFTYCAPQNPVEEDQQQKDLLKNQPLDSIIFLSDEEYKQQKKEERNHKKEQQNNNSLEANQKQKPNKIQKDSMWIQKKGTILKKLRVLKKEVSQLQEQENIQLNKQTLFDNNKNKLNKILSKTTDETLNKRRGNLKFDQQCTQRFQRKIIKKLTIMNDSEMQSRDREDYLKSQISEDQNEQNDINFTEHQHLYDMSFDQLQDWKFYFPSGNSKNIFQKYIRFQKRLCRLQNKRKYYK